MKISDWKLVSSLEVIPLAIKSSTRLFLQVDHSEGITAVRVKSAKRQEAQTMKRTKRPTKATLDRTPDTTGRDGAMDFVAKVESSKPVILNQRDDRFTRVMGSAVIDLWGNFPKDIQERLFERAVVLGHQGERDEMLREQLAKYLHDRHKRTAGNVRQRR